MNKDVLNYKVIAIKGFLCAFVTSFIMSANDGLSTKVSNEMAMMQMQNTDIPLVITNAFGKMTAVLSLTCVLIWILMFWKEFKYILKVIKGE